MPLPAIDTMGKHGDITIVLEHLNWLNIYWKAQFKNASFGAYPAQPPILTKDPAGLGQGPIGSSFLHLSSHQVPLGVHKKSVSCCHTLEFRERERDSLKP